MSKPFFLLLGENSKEKIMNERRVGEKKQKRDNERKPVDPCG